MGTNTARAGAPAEVMNAKALSAEGLRAAESRGTGALLETFRDIHHEIHGRAVQGNRCARPEPIEGAAHTLEGTA